jgi:hypothetical protein
MYIFSDAEAPSSMVKLHKIAELEEGWLMVVTSLVNTYAQLSLNS